jgi:AbrB family looped-hinge helix DNA binding protein
MHDHKHSFLGTATVGERGQVAIPADARRTLDIKPGTKLLFFTNANKGGLFMVKAEELGRLLEHLTNKAQNIEQLIKEAEENE